MKLDLSKHCEGVVQVVAMARVGKKYLSSEPVWLGFYDVEYLLGGGLERWQFRVPERP
jgi:hypothetical protein